MFERMGFPDMPTRSVVEELLSRTGSPNQYSLSPYQGMAKILSANKYANLRNLPDLGNILRMKDAFDFHNESIRYGSVDRDKDTMDEYEFNEAHPDEYDGLGNASKFRPDDVTAPEYFIRFEDSIPYRKMEGYIHSLLYNVQNNKDGYKSVKDKYETTYQYTGDSGEVIDESELQTEHFIEQADKQTLEDLAYSLHRMRMLSIETKVNMLSLVIAFEICEPLLKSAIAAKPAAILQYGKVYKADANGDCTELITNPQDRNFTKARKLLVTGSDNEYEDFSGDYLILINCLKALNIDIRKEDVRKYDHKFIQRISENILIYNSDYVSRVNGGYNRNTLKKLRNATLDETVTGSVVDEVNTVEMAITTVLDSMSTPEDIFRAFNKSYDKYSNPYAALLIQRTVKMNRSNFTIVSDEISLSGNIDTSGIVLSCRDGEYYKVNTSGIVPKEYAGYTTGYCYFHESGWMIFEPFSTATLILARTETVMSNPEFVKLEL